LKKKIGPQSTVQTVGKPLRSCNVEAGFLGEIQKGGGERTIAYGCQETSVTCRGGKGLLGGIENSALWGLCKKRREGKEETVLVGDEGKNTVAFRPVDVCVSSRKVQRCAGERSSSG